MLCPASIVLPVRHAQPALAVRRWAYSQEGKGGQKKAGGGRAAADEDEGQGAGGARARGGALARMRARRQTGGSDDEEDEDIGGKKVGKKKAAKLEAKEEKRNMREAMEEEKQKRKEKEEQRDLERQEAEAAKKKERAEKEEEERRLAEEVRKKEEEEFDKWKDMFETGEDGAQADDDLQESQGMLQEFIDYLKDNKITPLDEVAAKFGLKIQEVMTIVTLFSTSRKMLQTAQTARPTAAQPRETEPLLTDPQAVNRVEGLEAMGRITGLMDDRGKFIYISSEEMESVAKWINLEGRVSIEDLVNESARLIDMAPRAKAIVADISDEEA